MVEHHDHVDRAWDVEHGGPTPAQFRRLRRRLGLAVLAAALVLVGVGVLLGRQASAGRGPASGLGGIVVVVLVAIALRRITRRWGPPLEGVVAAVDRVADGDLAARAPIAGPRVVRRLAGRFNVMAERLASDDDRRSQLLADVAHELRTPLTVVRGTLEGVVDGVYDAGPGPLGRVLDELDHVERLLDDLRTLSNADAGALRLELEEVAPGPLARRVVDLHHHRASGRGIELSLDLADGLPTVQADPGRLEQVLGNLVDNAVRHAAGASRVVVEARSDGDELVVTVRDDGAGLPADQLDDVFERFRGRTDTDGSGLGLAIVRRLVERHGGTVDLANAESSGLVATVRLPAG